MTEDHSSRISDLYRQSSQETPPAHVDQAVLEKARKSVRFHVFSPFGNHWVAVEWCAADDCPSTLQDRINAGGITEIDDLATNVRILLLDVINGVLCGVADTDGVRGGVISPGSGHEVADHATDLAGAEDDDFFHCGRGARWRSYQ